MNRPEPDRDADNGASGSDGHRWYICTADGCSLGSGHTGPHRSASEERRLRLEAQKAVEQSPSDSTGAAARTLDEAVKWLRSALDYIEHDRKYDTKFACLDPWAFSQVMRLENDAAALVAAYDRERAS